MAHTLDDATAATLVALAPFVRTHPAAEQPARALAALVESEQVRRGAPEPVTGALHVTALTQGPLLRPEYDLSVHAHAGWPVSAVVADVRGMIHVNMEAGFPGGDRFLRAVAGALAATFPSARVVRIHTDCFAALFLPSSDETVTPEHLDRARTALAAAVDAFRAEMPSLRRSVDFTLSGLALRVHDPSHWQVLGPLVWAELERTHVLARRSGTPRIETRELRLDGRVALPPAEAP